jgi:signal transduction histidine kinase
MSCSDVRPGEGIQERLSRDLEVMTRLHRLSTRFVRAGELEAVLDEIVETAIAITRAEKGNLQLLDPATRRLRIAAQRGLEQWWLDFFSTVPEGRGASCGAALTTLERVIVEDVALSPIFAGTPALDVQLRAGIRAVQSTPLLSSSGELVGMISTHYGVPTRPEEADLKLLDVLARQTADMLERQTVEEALREADRRKGEFLAVLSHELRNPLAPIHNSLFVLDHAPADSEGAIRARDILKRQVAQLTGLVEDLLDVTRISRGKINLRRTRIDLWDVVRKAADDVRTQFRDAEVELRVDHPAEAIWVDGDPIRLAQVLGNLLSNALKFTPAGGAVDVSTGTSNSRAMLAVRDSGVGLEPELLERIWEPFSQGRQGLARTEGGLGLGLALVKGSWNCMVARSGRGARVRDVARSSWSSSRAPRLPPRHGPPWSRTGRAAVSCSSSRTIATPRSR